jgi:hypothetical protein
VSVKLQKVWKGHYPDVFPVFFWEFPKKRIVSGKKLSALADTCKGSMPDVRKFKRLPL